MNKIHDGVWQDYDKGDQISSKLKTIKAWIPQGVRTVLDVGCGNGKISNVLAENYEVMAVDISEVALAYVNTPKLQASATDIPLGDEAFDLVLSSEMLEHLTDEDLAKASGEISRLAKSYLLISVPYAEQLDRMLVKCADCGAVYHAYGHLQVFDRNRILSLFPKFRMIKQIVFGPMDAIYNSSLLGFRQLILGQYFHPQSPVVCPECASQKVVRRSNPLTKVINLLLKQTAKSQPYWLMVLMERKQA